MVLHGKRTRLSCRSVFLKRPCGRATFIVLILPGYLATVATWFLAGSNAYSGRVMLDQVRECCARIHGRRTRLKAAGVLSLQNPQSLEQQDAAFEINVKS